MFTTIDIDEQKEIVRQTYAALKVQMERFGLVGTPTYPENLSEAFKNDPTAVSALKTYRRENARLSRLRHPERESVYGLRYREAHLEESRRSHLESTRKFRKAHPGRAVELARRYREEHPERVSEYSQRRRAMLVGGDGSYTAEEFEQLCQEFDYRCAYCRRLKEEVGKLVPDHMTPLSKGGNNSIWNIIPSCSHCNGSKGNKTAEEFLDWLDRTFPTG